MNIHYTAQKIQASYFLQHDYLFPVFIALEVFKIKKTINI